MRRSEECTNSFNDYYPVERRARWRRSPVVSRGRRARRRKRVGSALTENSEREPYVPPRSLGGDRVEQPAPYRGLVVLVGVRQAVQRAVVCVGPLGGSPPVPGVAVCDRLATAGTLHRHTDSSHTMATSFINLGLSLARRPLRPIASDSPHGTGVDDAAATTCRGSITDGRILRGAHSACGWSSPSGSLAVACRRASATTVERWWRRRISTAMPNSR